MTATDTDILEVVQRYLARHQPASYQIQITPDQVRHDGNWWYVVVAPSHMDINTSDYFRYLEATEEELSAQENLNVLLVPVLPGD